MPGGVDITFKEPLGRGRGRRPLEFPDANRGLGLRSCWRPGNTVVLKPAELTPLTALRLAELGLDPPACPGHVFTVLPGEGAVVGERFVSHPHVRKVVFTGSTEVGKRVMAGCAEQVKRVTFELGGKSANIVFADADIERAAATAPMSVFDNAGQDCCARSRILVERTVYDRFLELLETSRQGGAGRGPIPRVERNGAAHNRSAKRPRSPLTFPTKRLSRSAGSCPERPGYWYPRPCSPRSTRRPGISGGDLRACRGGGAV